MVKIVNPNLLTLIKVFLASVVLINHLDELAYSKELLVGYFPSSLLSINAFFILSGFLIMKSIEGDSSSLFLKRRTNKIFPSYLIVILLSAIFASVALSLSGKMDWPAVSSYLGWNSVFLNFMEPSIEGIFPNNTHREINGALWTIKIEVLYYLFFFLTYRLLSLLGGSPKQILISVCITFLAVNTGFEYALEIMINRGLQENMAFYRQLPFQLPLFMLGIAIYFFQLSKANIFESWFSFVVMVFITGFCLSKIEFLYETVIFCLIFIFILNSNFDIPIKIPDVTYELYLVHCPLIQVGAAMGLFLLSDNTWLVLLTTYLVLVAFSLLLFKVSTRLMPFKTDNQRTAHK